MMIFVILSAIRSVFSWPQISARAWMRFFVISGVLFLSALVAHGITPMVAAAIIALPIGLWSLIVLLRKPFLGPIVLILTGLLGNFAITDNFNASVLLLCLLTGVWILDMLVRKQLLANVHWPAVRPLLFMVGVTLLAFVMGQLPWYSVPSAPMPAQIGGLLVTVLSVSAFLLVATYITELRHLKWMVWLFVIVGGLYVVGRVAPYPLRYLILLFPWGSTAALYWLFVCTHIFSQMLFNRDIGLAGRLLLGVLLVASLYAVVIQTYDWKSGWVPILPALGVIAALRWPRMAVWMGMLGVLLIPAFIPLLIADDEYSYETRVDAWLIMLDIIRVNPIIGLGPSNYHWYSHLYTIRGYEVNFNSHMQYIDLLAQTGIIGLVSYLWFFWAIFRVAWRLRQLVPQGFAQAYVNGAVGAICGMLISGVLGDWILPFVYNVGLVGMRSSLLGWIFLGGLLTLERLYGARNAGDAAPDDAETSLTEKGRQPIATVPYY